jgi:hypothetical protein
MSAATQLLRNEDMTNSFRLCRAKEMKKRGSRLQDVIAGRGSLA